MNWWVMRVREPFGYRLHQIRTKKGMLQQELAEKIGIPASQISRYEKGKLSPTITTLEWICDALGVTATELLGY
jgi:transcriptional regulator with XRE-family HTH domain